MTRRRLMVIEDDAGDVDILRDALHHLGAHVDLVHAHDGPAALQMLAGRGRHEGSPAPDLILLDLMLPALDGEDVLRLLKANAEWSGIPVFALTCVSDPASHRRCVAAGAIGCYRKPANWRGYVELASDLVAGFSHPDGLERRLAALAARGPSAQ